MKQVEKYLRFTSEWVSDFKSVNTLLSYLLRIGGSVASRKLYCWTVYSICKYLNKLPDDLIQMEKTEIETLVQEFCDIYFKKYHNPNSSNVKLQILKTFFKVNGFKREKELDIQGYSKRLYYHQRPEYIPTLQEILSMANSSGSLRNRAIILTLFSTGLRNSTLRAIRYGDVREELEKGLDIIHILVSKEMKRLDPNACKGGHEYDIFTNLEATKSIRLYIKERIRRFGKIDDDEPLFISEPSKLRGRWRKFHKILTASELQLIVKEAAQRAGIENWINVRPHVLRKNFNTILRSPLVDENRLDVQTQEILVGHKLPGSMHFYYRASTEDLRKEYAKLVFTPPNEKMAEIIEVLNAIARTLGVDIQQSPEEIFRSIKQAIKNKGIHNQYEQTLNNTIIEESELPSPIFLTNYIPQESPLQKNVTKLNIKASLQPLNFQTEIKYDLLHFFNHHKNLKK